MAEFTLNGREWRTQKLDALSQLAIAIKVLPLVPKLRPLMTAVADMRRREEVATAAVAEGREPEAPPPDDGAMEQMLVHLGAALNELGDDGRNYVIGTCMKRVLMQVGGGGFLPAWSVRDEAPDPSIDLVTMMRLVYSVIMDNISDFSTALGSK